VHAAPPDGRQHPQFIMRMIQRLFGRLYNAPYVLLVLTMLF
jgi:hypothetical protein